MSVDHTMMIEYLELLAICLVPLAMGWWPCPECCDQEVEQADDECTVCVRTPKFLEVAIGGSLTSKTCDQCPSVPNTYVIKQLNAALPCFWRIGLCQCPAVGNDPMVEARVLIDTGTYYLEVRIVVGTGSSTDEDQALYRKNLGTTEPDCLLFENESLTYDSTSPDDDACDGWSGLTVDVTAVNGPETDNPQCGYCNQDTYLQTRTVTFNGTAPVNQLCTDCAEFVDLVVTMTFTGNFGFNCCSSFGSYVGSNCSYTFSLVYSATEILLSVASASPSGTQATWKATGLSNPRDCSVAVNLPFFSDTPGGACESFSNITSVDVSIAT